MASSITNAGNYSSEKSEKIMRLHFGKVINSLTACLLALTGVLAGNMACIGYWGEEEVPACLRKELEENAEEQ